MLYNSPLVDDVDLGCSDLSSRRTCCPAAGSVCRQPPAVVSFLFCSIHKEIPHLCFYSSGTAHVFLQSIQFIVWTPLFQPNLDHSGGQLCMPACGLFQTEILLFQHQSLPWICSIKIFFPFFSQVLIPDKHTKLQLPRVFLYLNLQ